MKECTKCKIEKDETEFYRYGIQKKYVYRECKSCTNVRSTAYAKAHRDKVKIWARTWQLNNKEVVNKKAREWKRNNREKAREISKKSYQRHIDKVRMKQKEWKALNVEHIREYNKKQVDSLPLWYLNTLAKQLGLQSEAISQYPQLLDLIKLGILNKREIKKQTT